MKNLIGIALLMTLLISCKKETTKLDPEYFSFGTAYGECGGNCANFFQIRDGQLFPDDMDYLVSPLVFQDEALPSDKYELAKTLLDSFPTYFLDDPNQTYGCPDCADQGGIHIEMKKNGEVIYWHIDTIDSNQPEEVQDYIAELRSILDQL